MARLPGQAISGNAVMVNRSKPWSIIGDMRSKWLSTVTTPAISVRVFVLTPIQTLSVNAQIHRADALSVSVQKNLRTAQFILQQNTALLPQRELPPNAYIAIIYDTKNSEHFHRCMRHEEGQDDT